MNQSTADDHGEAQVPSQAQIEQTSHAHVHLSLDGTAQNISAADFAIFEAFIQNVDSIDGSAPSAENQNIQVPVGHTIGELDATFNLPRVESDGITATMMNRYHN